MSTSAGQRRDARIASALLAMRTPLARVELAASQLARDAATPTARSLATAISEAVGELDRQLDGSLRALAAELPGPPKGADCRPVLDALRARLDTVLRARRVTASVRLPDTPVPGDGEVVRQAALVLLRAGLRLAGDGGQLALGLVEDGGRWGISLEASAADPPCSEPPADAFAPARELAWLRGGELVLENSTAVLWFEREGGA